MSTPTSVDQTVQRDLLPLDQAATPGSPITQDLAGGINNNKVVNDDFASSSGPDTPDAAAETLSLSPSILHLTPSSSSPQTSSTEDSPREASSSTSSDYDSDSESSDDEILDTERSEARYKKIIADSEAAEEHDVYRSDDGGDNMPEGMALVGVQNAKSDIHVTGEKDKNQANTSATTTKGWQHLRRRTDTCLGAGWAPGDALPNRTFANEYIAVAKSALQGHGVFAAADIKEGTEVLIEAPLLRAKGLGKLCAKHARLNEEEKAVYDGLVGYHEWETCPVRQKWCANSFDLGIGSANAVFAIASNFNHACRGWRNTKYDWDQREQVMTFTATRDIEKGAEMLVSYCDYRHVLKEVYGFVCRCGGCEHQEANLGVTNWY